MYEFTEIKPFEEANEVELPKHKIVCPLCNGKGKHVNPAVDGHGLNPDDPDLDEEFWNSYCSGAYDIPCEVCNGRNVVDEVANEVLQDTNPELYRLWTSWINDAYDDAAERAAEIRAGC